MSRSITLNFTDDLAKQLTDHCRAKNVAASAVVREAVRQYFERRAAQPTREPVIVMSNKG